jgi:hypothetical protein
MAGVTSRQEAEDRLKAVRSLFVNGRVPINSAGVTVLPAQGSCPVELRNFYLARGVNVYQGTWPP